MDSQGTVAFVGDGSTAYLTSFANGTISVDSSSAPNDHGGTLLAGQVGNSGTPVGGIYTNNVFHSAGVTHSGPPPAVRLLATWCSVPTAR